MLKFNVNTIILHTKLKININTLKMPDPVTGHCQAGPCSDVRVRIQRVTGAGGINLL